jgi:heme/copper-type cytochrome/quinol oxidase subunit 2
MVRVFVALVLTLAACGAATSTAAAEERNFTIVNIEYEGTKVWVPGTLIVKKGDHVKIKLINNVASDPNQHGFAIEAFKVAAVVNRSEPATVEFDADKAGIFPILCHLHPAHIGGQLLVME